MTAKLGLDTGTHAFEYVRHRFAVCAIPHGRKGPTAKGWNLLENAITNPNMAATLTGNVGLLHAWSATMALDVDDRCPATEWLLARGVNLGQLFGASDRVEIVSGRVGRGKLLFRLPTSLDAPVQTLQIKGGDGAMILEFRCADKDGNSVQDVLPPSIHPDTGRPYLWGGTGHWCKLPVIPEALLQLWKGELAKREMSNAPAAPLPLPLGFAPQSFASRPGFAPLEEGLFGVTVVESALHHVSADVVYDTWRNIGWAIMSTGWKCAPQIIHGWSRRAPLRYDIATTDTLIRGFDPTKGITIATLFHHAKQNGWTMPQQYPLEVMPSAPPVAPPPAILPAGTGVISLPRQLPAAQAVQLMNQHIGFAHDWGGKSTHFRIDGAGRVHPSSPHEMKEALASLSIVAADGMRKPAYPIWNSSPERREVAEVRFDPTGRVTTSSGQPMLNLFRGFNRKARRGLCKMMLRHLRDVVCSSNLEHFRYLLAWMAHLVQKPWEAPGVVVVLRSAAEGTGKSSVGVWLAEMLGDHALVMAEPTQLLSKFNAHLETRCLVVLNELQWAGDKDAASKFKSIVTDPYLTVERKHGGVYSVPNILHIMAATNAEWAVPAGHGARRWFVLDVEQARTRDHAYFDALHHEAENGGIEALMYILQRFKLGCVNLRAVPVTEALREQQERSLSLHAQWALDLADRGGVWFDEFVESRLLYNDYFSYVQLRRVRPLASNALGRYLTRLKVPLDHTSTGGRRAMPAADAFAARVRNDAGIHS